jgi:hypothetical protein
MCPSLPLCRYEWPFKNRVECMLSAAVTTDLFEFPLDSTRSDKLKLSARVWNSMNGDQVPLNADIGESQMVWLLTNSDLTLITGNGGGEWDGSIRRHGARRNKEQDCDESSSGGMPSNPWLAMRFIRDVCPPTLEHKTYALKPSACGRLTIFWQMSTPASAELAAALGVDVGEVVWEGCHVIKATRRTGQRIVWGPPTLSQQVKEWRSKFFSGFVWVHWNTGVCTPSCDHTMLMSCSVVGPNNYVSLL